MLPNQFKSSSAPYPIPSVCYAEFNSRYHGDIMNKSAYELIKWVAVVKEEIPSVKIPFMCLHGEKDIIALPRGSQYLLDNTGTSPSQKSLSILPDLRHEVFHERLPEGPQSIQSVLTYFESMMPKVA
jgi:esterase/lipase